MHGVAKHVEQMQTDTGTKDKFAQQWIEILLRKARKMKTDDPKRSADSIVSELLDWYTAQPGDKFNPLLSLDSKKSTNCLSSLIFLSIRSRPRPRYSSGNSSHHLAWHCQVFVA